MNANLIKAQALEEVADELTIPAREVAYRSFWRLGKRVTRTTPASFYAAAPVWLRARAARYRADS